MVVPCHRASSQDARSIVLASSYYTTLTFFFFFSSRRRHTRSLRDWSSDVCSSDLVVDRALAAATRDVERTFGEAEVFLHVDQEQVHARLVGRGRLDGVLLAPFGGDRKSVV